MGHWHRSLLFWDTQDKTDATQDLKSIPITGLPEPTDIGYLEVSVLQPFVACHPPPKKRKDAKSVLFSMPFRKWRQFVRHWFDYEITLHWVSLGEEVCDINPLACWSARAWLLVEDILPPELAVVCVDYLIDRNENVYVYSYQA